MQLRKSVSALAASCCQIMRHWSLQNSSARSNRSFLAASTWASAARQVVTPQPLGRSAVLFMPQATTSRNRSEEHTSELQSLAYLVCRLLLEKKKKNYQHSSM